MKNDFCALAVFDRDMRYIYVSDQYLQNSLFTQEEVMGKSQYNIFPDMPDRWKVAYAKALRGESFSYNEENYTRKDGKKFTTRWKTYPWYLSSGEVGGVILYTDLISERIQLEKSLQKEQELTRLVLQTMGQGIAILNHDMIIEYVNPAFCKMLGYTPADLIGKKPYDVTAPEYQSKIPEIYSKRMIGETDQFESRFIHADGRVVPVLITGAPRYENGRIVGAVSTINDITESKKASLEIQKITADYKRIFNGTQEAIFLIEVTENHEFRYVHNNRAHQERTGFSTKAIKGKTNSGLVGPEMGAQLDSNYQKCIDLRSSLVYEEELDFPAGIRIWETSITPIFEQDKISYIVGSSTDMTEQRKAEAEQEKLQNELFQMQKMDSIGRLAGGIAHDFNNMLGVILGHADLAIDMLEENSQIADSLEEIRKAAFRSANIASQLLTFSRKQPTQSKVINLNTVISHTIDMLSHMISEEIKLDHYFEKNLWLITCDPHQLEQILTNLSLNASDAITGNGTITITTSNKVLNKQSPELQQNFMPGEFVALSVKDTGSGIPEKLQGQLFEPFFTTKAAGKGTGLGLSIVHGIVNQHNGFINVKSDVGVGTEFAIYFPRSTEKETPAEHIQKENKQFYGTETILVVEDEQAILHIIQTILTKFGYTVIAVSSSNEAFSIIQENPDAIDLLVTDVIMPELNGSELVEKIKLFRNDLKSLFISGYTSDIIPGIEKIDNSVNLLQKPFSSLQLSKKVREILDS